jgi:hypothetical protein
VDIGREGKRFRTEPAEDPFEEEPATPEPSPDLEPEPEPVPTGGKVQSSR